MRQQILMSVYLHKIIFATAANRVFPECFWTKIGEEEQCADKDYSCLIASFEKEGKVSFRLAEAYYARAGEFIDQENYNYER